jgi:hypothetical protein
MDSYGDIKILIKKWILTDMAIHILLIKEDIQ